MILVVNDSYSIFTVHIHKCYWIVLTINIRANIIVFLCQRIHTHPSSQHSIIVACTIIIPIQSVHTIKFLAVVLVRLRASACTLTHQFTKGIVMIHLLHLSMLIYHYTIVSKVILQIVMVCWSGICKCDVSHVGKNLA